MKDLLAIALLVHAASTLAMTGLIWFVQIVHYPLFSRVGGREFATYEQGHTRRTACIVMPLMLAEVGSAFALAALLPEKPLVWAGLGLLAIVWISTFLLQVPQHRRLARGFDLAAHRRLVGTNWLRTAAWSARGVVALFLLARVV